MDSVAVTVPLRPPTKKMKKRKELDALAPPHAISRRSSSGKRSSQKSYFYHLNTNDDKLEKKELLSDSSDDRSAEYWNVSTRGVRCKSVRDRPRPACRGLFRACGVFLGGTLVLVTVILIWLFMDVRQQLTALRAELDQVIAGSEGVPQALQTCHTLEKSFITNITHINNEMQKLNSSIDNFSGQILSLQQELQQVQNSLKSAPELTRIPNTVNDLQNTIGQLTFDIRDLKTSYDSLKNSTFTLEQLQNKQRLNLTNFETKLNGLSNKTVQPVQAVPITNETLVETKKLWDAVAELSKNLTHINQTLTTDVTWIKEDFDKDHKTVVSLQDMAQNASAQIVTLQQECIKRKDYDVLQNLLHSLSDRVNKVSIGTNTPGAPKEIEHLYNVPQNSSGNIMMSASSNQATVVEPNKKDATDAKPSVVPKASPVSPLPPM